MGLQIAGVTVVDDDRQGTFNFANVSSSSAVASFFNTSPLNGTVAGFSTGGAGNPGPAGLTIDKFSFASDSNAIDYGDPLVDASRITGQSSQYHGYYSADQSPDYKTIAKFSFATYNSTFKVGVLTQGRNYASGQSSREHGYTSGGFVVGPPPNQSNVIDKFPFAADVNATDVGDLFLATQGGAGQSSLTNGYCSGGSPPSGGYTTTIQNFPFSSDSNGSDVSDLYTAGTYTSAGQSSNERGYVSGGTPDNPVSPTLNVIQKFPFTTISNSTDVGDLTVSRLFTAGQSATLYGYTSGGASPPVTNFNTIDKFSFTSDGNATDVGDLLVAKSESSGQQD